MKHEDARVLPADEGRLEAPVRPLIERLRDYAQCTDSDIDEAAAEIERLNAWAVAYYKETRHAILYERERCAKACEALFSPAHSGYGEGYNEALHDCAAAIRGGPNVRNDSRP